MLARFKTLIRYVMLIVMVMTSGALMFGAAQGDSGITGWARLIPVALTVVLIVSVYFFAKELIGRWWALLPTFLAAFSPNFLASSRHLTTDVAATLGIFTTITIFLSYLLSPSKKKVVFVGLVFGLTQLMSFSTFLLVPYFFLLTGIFYFLSLARDLKHFRALLTMFLIGYTLFYAVYFFASFGPDLLTEFKDWLSTASRSLVDLPRTFLMTEPLPSLMMVFFALGLFLLGAGKFVIARILWRAHEFRDYLMTNFAEFAMLVFIAMYWLSGIAGNNNFGVQQLLPIMPFVYILTAETIRGWFNIGHLDKIRNFAIKIMVLYQELVSISIKSTILAGLLLWYLIAALVHFT